MLAAQACTKLQAWAKLQAYAAVTLPAASALHNTDAMVCTSANLHIPQICSPAAVQGSTPTPSHLRASYLQWVLPQNTQGMNCQTQTSDAVCASYLPACKCL